MSKKPPIAPPPPLPTSVMSPLTLGDPELPVGLSQRPGAPSPTGQGRKNSGRSGLSQRHGVGRLCPAGISQHPFSNGPSPCWVQGPAVGVLSLPH